MISLIIINKIISISKCQEDELPPNISIETIKIKKKRFHEMCTKKKNDNEI